MKQIIKDIFIYSGISYCGLQYNEILYIQQRFHLLNRRNLLYIVAFIEQFVDNIATENIQKQIQTVILQKFLSFINTKIIMSQESQPLVYHSLSRHVHSIPSEADHLKTFNFYSSNQQPPIPSILQRSRTKKSHQKSLKKGLSRVSKSKQNFNTGQTAQKQVEQRNLSKGTLLNFNIQQVVQNKFYIAKPRDQIHQISPKKNQITSTKQFEYSQPGSNEKSFISQYRIVTYVPSGRVDDRRQSFARDEKESMRNESGVLENWDKQNNSNNSNVFIGHQGKQDSQQIQIVNPMQENNLSQNTWRTSENFDPYYSKNFSNQINQTNEKFRTTEMEIIHPALRPKYSVSENNEVGEIRSSILENEVLKEKIKHLEHEIVEIEREKGSLEKNINEKERDNKLLKDQNVSLKEEILSLKEDIESGEDKIKRLNDCVMNLQEKISVLSNDKGNCDSDIAKEKSFSESYLFEETMTDKRQQSKHKNLQQTLRKQINSLEEDNQVLSLAKARLEKQLSQKTLSITELTRKNKDLTEKGHDLEKQLKKDTQKMQAQQQKLYKKDQKINSLSLQVDRLNLLIKDLKEKLSTKDSVKEQINETPKNHVIEDTLREQLGQITRQYEQLQRDYTHLQKKHAFMKDELQHLKYLQLNASSSALSQRSNTQNNYSSLNGPNTLNTSNNIREKELQQTINELETKLQITQRNFRQIEEEYSNLKQNFRALQELYIKQQDENYQLQQQTQRLSQEINKLKIQLINQQQISKAKLIANSQHQLLKAMEKEQELMRLKKQYANLERRQNEIQAQYVIVQRKLTETEKEYSHLQRKVIQTQRKCIEIQKNEIQTERKYTQTQRRQLETETYLRNLENELNSIKNEKDLLYDKYLSQLQKNTKLTQRYKEDLNRETNKLQKQEKQKIQIVVDKYETLILKLQEKINSFNTQINSYKAQINNLKDAHSHELKLRQDKFTNELKITVNKHIDELAEMENQHKEQVQTLLTEIDRQQLFHKDQISKLLAQINKPKDCFKCKELQIERQKESDNRYGSASKMNRFFTYESMSRKQLQNFTSQLHSDFTLIQNRYKTLLIQKQGLQDHLQSTSRHITHLQQEIRVYKEQKQNSLKQKYELRQQVERTNLLMLEMKKNVSLFDEQKASLNQRINELNQKYLSTVNDYENVIQELKDVKNILCDKEIALQNYQHDVRELRINILQEKERTEQNIREIQVLKDQKQTLKSKEEYYKMLFEKTQKQLEIELQQKAVFLSTHVPKVLNTSLIKQKSPQKRPSFPKSQQVSPKTRQTQLYRLQVFKDLNKILNLTSEHFTLEEIIERNQQEYLRMLFNAIKQDHNKIIELKQLIVDMEESFKKEKVFIKQDYDVLYEKYLKYKNMCQDMNRDIERYKLKLKSSKDHNFMNIDV